MTQTIFGEYLDYINGYMISLSKHIVMFCDAPAIHMLGLLDENDQLIIQPFTNILLIYLPHNCTSVLQPADQGIINSFKCHYRFNLLSKAESYLHNQDNQLHSFKLSQYIKFADMINMVIKKIHI